MDQLRWNRSAECVRCGADLADDFGSASIPRVPGRCIICSMSCDNCAASALVGATLVCTNPESPNGGRLVTPADSCHSFSVPAMPGGPDRAIEDGPYNPELDGPANAPF
jgi:hypothetical protein